MIYDGMDLSEWDLRTLQIVEKYDDLEGRFEHLMELYHNETKFVELDYLRHIGQDVFHTANRTREYDPQSAINYYREANKIFELLIELDNISPTPRRRGIAKQFIYLNTPPLAVWDDS